MKLSCLLPLQISLAVTELTNQTREDGKTEVLLTYIAQLSSSFSSPNLALLARVTSVCIQLPTYKCLLTYLDHTALQRIRSFIRTNGTVFSTGYALAEVRLISAVGLDANGRDLSIITTTTAAPSTEGASADGSSSSNSVLYAA
jgi:hypothetical protein